MKLKMDQVGLKMYKKGGTWVPGVFFLQSCGLLYSPLLRKISLAEKTWRIWRVPLPHLQKKSANHYFKTSVGEGATPSPKFETKGEFLLKNSFF